MINLKNYIFIIYVIVFITGCNNPYYEENKIWPRFTDSFRKSIDGKELKVGGWYLYDDFILGDNELLHYHSVTGYGNRGSNAWITFSFYRGANWIIVEPKVAGRYCIELIYKDPKKFNMYPAQCIDYVRFTIVN